MYKKFCDVCNKRVNTTARCRTCGSSSSYSEETHYHKACLKKVNNDWYCPIHAADHIDNGVVISYLKRTWAGLGLGGTLSVAGQLDEEDWTDITIKFPTITLLFKGSYLPDSKRLAFTSDRTHIIRVGLHDHAGFRNGLKEMATIIVESTIKNSLGHIKTNKRDMKAWEKTLEKQYFLRDVLNKKAKWPVVVPPVVEAPPPVHVGPPNE